MKHLKKKFSSPPPNQNYRDNWDAVFGEEQEKAETPVTESRPVRCEHGCIPCDCRSEWR